MIIYVSIICFGWRFISFWWGIFCVIRIIVLLAQLKAKSFLYPTWDFKRHFYRVPQMWNGRIVLLVVDLPNGDNALTYSIWRKRTMQTIFHPSSTSETFNKGIFLWFLSYWTKGTLEQILFFWSNFSKRKSYCQLVELLNSFLKRMLFK